MCALNTFLFIQISSSRQHYLATAARCLIFWAQGISFCLSSDDRHLKLCLLPPRLPASLFHQSCAVSNSPPVVPQSLFSPTCFSYASQYISRYESQGQGRSLISKHFRNQAKHVQSSPFPDPCRPSVEQLVHFTHLRRHGVLRLAVLVDAHRLPPLLCHWRLHPHGLPW